VRLLCQPSKGEKTMRQTTSKKLLKTLSALEVCMDAIRNTPRQKGEPHEKPLRDACMVAHEAVLAAKRGGNV
jgi:hypothetical protein